MEKAKEIVKDNLKTAISQLGGIKAVSDRFEIPYRTVQNWSDGTRTPPNYVYRMIVEIDQLEKTLDATREELAKERHAREVWARQAGMLTRR